MSSCLLLGWIKLDMHAPPRFTVVIPVHNKGHLLSDALASVATQSFPDFDVIVVDDASTDEGLAVVQEYKGLHVQVLHRHTPGPGGYAARNLAIRAARGEWIAFLDADDLWYSNHLSIAAEEIDRYPQVAVVCTGFQEDLGGQVETIAVPQTTCVPSAEMIRMYARQDYFHTNSMVVRRSALIQAGGFPEHGVRRGGDHSLWLRLILLGHPIVLASPVTTCYRRDHSGVVADPTAMAGVHPVATVVAQALSGQIRIPADWGPKELLALRRLANRRCLLWMLQRRIAGLVANGSQCRPPYWSALTMPDFLRWFMALVASPRAIARLRHLRRHLRTRVHRSTCTRSSFFRS